jgi:uncharacterized protein YkwD
MYKSRSFRLLVCIIATLVGLLSPGALPAFSQSSGRASVSQKRSGQLGTRHHRAPEPRDSSAADSNSDTSTGPIIGHELREIALLEEQCLGEVNRLRRAHGLESLDFDEELLEVARAYSRRMAEEKFFSHADPEGRSVRERVNEAGISWQMVGENLAYSNGYINPVAASLRGWMESAPHKRNLLEAGFQQTAIGVWISSNGTVYFTEIFMKK